MTEPLNHKLPEKTGLAGRLGDHTQGEPTDRQVIDRVLGGEGSAYGLLVRRYQDRLFNTLTRIMSSPDDAEDITQDALMQAYVKLASFQGKAAFYTWLYRIAFNLAMSHQRKRRPVTLPDPAGPHGSADPTAETPSPEECVMTAERVGEVQEAIAQLGDEQRQVVVLREMEGCDYEQIAAILEIPIGTVRSRLFRARQELKAKLTPSAELG